jgi:hypothetical protein
MDELFISLQPGISRYPAPLFSLPAVSNPAGIRDRHGSCFHTFTHRNSIADAKVTVPEEK